METLKNQESKIKYRSRLMTNEEFLFGRNLENASKEENQTDTKTYEIKNNISTRS